MHTAKTIILTTFLLLSLALPALTPRPVHAQTAPIIMASPREGWPPFIIAKPKANDAGGIMPDVLREICARTGHKVEIQFYPEKRAVMLLAQGRIDAYPKSPKWVDAPSLFLWSDPVEEVGDVIVFRRDAPIRFTSVSDLEGKSLGTIHGFKYPTLDRHIENGAIKTYTAICTEHLMRMLARRHVDGIVTPRHVAEWIIRNQPDLDPEDFAFSEHPVGSAPYGFAFAKGKGWEPFIEQFNKELKAMREDGRMEAILNMYR